MHMFLATFTTLTISMILQAQKRTISLAVENHRAKRH